VEGIFHYFIIKNASSIAQAARFELCAPLSWRQMCIACRQPIRGFGNSKEISVGTRIFCLFLPVVKFSLKFRGHAGRGAS
jgi:hypothetical protein